MKKICKQCGNALRRKERETLREFDRRKFCGHECYGKSREKPIASNGRKSFSCKQCKKKVSKEEWTKKYIKSFTTKTASKYTAERMWYLIFNRPNGHSYCSRSCQGRMQGRMKKPTNKGGRVGCNLVIERLSRHYDEMVRKKNGKYEVVESRTSRWKPVPKTVWHKLFVSGRKGHTKGQVPWNKGTAKKYKKTCPQCSVNFQARRKTRICCSHSCRSKLQYKSGGSLGLRNYKYKLLKTRI